MFNEIIIGHITDEVAAIIKQRGRKLRFMHWSKHGLPAHQVI